MAKIGTGPDAVDSKDLVKVGDMINAPTLKQSVDGKVYINMPTMPLYIDPSNNVYHREDGSGNATIILAPEGKILAWKV